jgi:glycosyltransferase involved in cell wall biosynthesis
MKIAIVHSFYSSLVPSGENNVVMAQVAALEARGHEVHLIAAYTDDLVKNRGYKIRTAFNVAAQRGSSPLEELAKFDPDVVHVHNLFPNFSRRWLDSWDGPMVVTLHNYRPVCAAGTLFRNGRPCSECIDIGTHRSVVNRCYRESAIATIPLAIQTRSGVHGDAVIQRANRVIVLSERAHDLYTSLGIDEGKMELVPNFVNERGFTPESPPGDHWTYIGRLTPEKGILNLIRSWPSEMELRIYGDGPLRVDVEASAAAVPNISFCGNAPRSEVPRILSESRGLVFPSEWPEGAPLVYLEALAAGRPIVARTGNSVGDDVADHATGQVYRDDNELPICLTQVSAAWGTYHETALVRFASTYSSKAWTKRIEAIYASAIGRSHQK